MARLGRTFLITSGILSLLSLVASIIVVLKLDTIVNSAKSQLLPQLSQRLGRPVTLGRIKVTFTSGLGVELEDLSVGPDATTPVDQLPLLQLRRARVQVALFRALVSLGKSLHVSEVRLDGPLVNVVRLPDGRLNVDVLSEHLAATAPPKETTAPMSERTKELLENARIGELRIEEGQVRFVDLKDNGTPVAINQLEVVVSDLGIKRPFTADVRAAVLAAARNFELHSRFGAPGRLDDASPPLESLRVKLDKTDLAPLAPFIGGAMEGLKAATASADLDAELGALSPRGKGPTKVQGTVGLGGVRFAGGAPFDAGLVADVAGNADAGDIDVRSLRATFGPMALVGHGQLHQLKSAPRFQDFSVESQAIDFDAARRLYPLLDKKAGVTLHGSASLRAVASGTAAAQTFDVHLDLTPAAIHKEELFAKPAGTPLRIRLGGNLQADALDLQTLSLELADLIVKGGGRVSHFKKPSYQLRADGDVGNLAGLLRLLPAVARDLPAGTSVAGALGIHANASGSGDDTTAHAELTLRGANLKLTAARLDGGGRLVADVERRGEAAKLKAEGNFDELEAFYEKLLHKPKAMPLSFTLNAEQKKTALTPTLDLRLAGMRAQLNGTVMTGADPDVDLRLSIESLTMAALSALLPTLGPGMPPIALSANAHIAGRSNRPEQLRAEVTNLQVRSRKSDLTGSVTVQNLVRPNIDLKARSTYLDTADLLPADSGSAKANPPPQPNQPPAKTPSPLANVSGHASVAVASGIASGVPFTDMQAELGIRNGQVRAEKLEVGAWGGRFSGTGSEFDLVDEHGPFKLLGKVTNFEIEPLLARFFDSHGVLRGKLHADVNVSGQGTTVPDLQRSLAGSLAGTLNDAKILVASLTDSVGEKLISQMPLKGRAAKVASGTDLKTLAGQVQFAAGAMRFAKPITANTPQGPLSLTGQVFLDGRLDLGGTFHLSPEAVASAFGSQVKLKEPLPLSLRIGGDMRHPQIGLANMGDAVKLLAAAGLQGQVGNLLKGSGLAGKVPGLDPSKIPTSTAEARAKAEAAAKAAQAQAQAQAQAAQRAAEERARQQAEAAKRELEKKAGDKLKGIFNR